MVKRAWERGRQKYPDVILTREAFEKYLSERGPIGELHNLAADLYLACACLLRAPGAAMRFHKSYIASLPSYLGTLARSREFVSALQVELTKELLFGFAGGPKLLEYTGQGSLEGFVRRAAIELARLR